MCRFFCWKLSKIYLCDGHVTFQQNQKKETTLSVSCNRFLMCNRRRRSWPFIRSWRCVFIEKCCIVMTHVWKDHFCRSFLFILNYILHVMLQKILFFRWLWKSLFETIWISLFLISFFSTLKMSYKNVLFRTVAFIIRSIVRNKNKNGVRAVKRWPL